MHIIIISRGKYPPVKVKEVLLYSVYIYYSHSVLRQTPKLHPVDLTVEAVGQFDSLCSQLLEGHPALNEPTAFQIYIDLCLDFCGFISLSLTTPFLTVPC